MKKITLLLLLLAVSLGYSQQTLQDFESGGLGDPFGGLASATVVADPEAMGTRGMVAELITSDAGNIWQGTNINISPNVLLTTDKTMTIDVYSTAALSIAVKVTGSVEGVATAPDATTSIDHTGTGWETITATFNTSQDNSGVANGTYTNFVVYPLWDTNTNTFINPAIARTVYVDNLVGNIPPESCTDGVMNNGETEIDCGGPNCDACIPLPPDAPNPTTPDGEVLSIYNDVPGFSNVYGVEFSFGVENRELVNLGTGVDEAIKLNLSSGGFGQGNNTTVNLTAAGYNFVNFSYYAPNVSAGVNGHHVQFILSDGAEKQYNLKTDGSGDGILVFDSWETVSIPLASFPGGFNPANFLLYKLGAPSDLNTALVYFDNIYFSVSAGTLGNKDFAKSSFNVYPNPSHNSWTVRTDNVNISSIKVYDVLGKSVLSIAPNANEAKINGSSLKSGLYFAQIKTEAGLSSIKLVKQ